MSCKVRSNTPRVAHVGINTLAFQSPGERPSEKHVGKFGATVCLEWTVRSLSRDRNAEKNREKCMLLSKTSTWRYKRYKRSGVKTR